MAEKETVQALRDEIDEWLNAHDLAEKLSAVAECVITEAQVAAIAARGNLIRPDGTISLLEYTAFLISETAKNG